MNANTIAHYEPRSPDDAADVMREAACANQRLAFVGGGTHVAPLCKDVDAVLSTRSMSEVIEYAPEDQTVTVQAGITLGLLAQTLASHRQRLVVEAAEPERATVGGAIAANVWGPRRMCYGSLKDLILGISLVRADGTRAHAGGKVVKNVAGFDLSKLMVGSYGTLALISAATLRVHPLPELTRAFRAPDLTADSVWQFVTAIRSAQLEPAAIVAARVAAGQGYRIDVLLEGFGAGVSAKSDMLLGLAHVGGWRLDETDCHDAERLDSDVRRGGPLRVRCSAPAADFAAVDRLVVGPIMDQLAAARSTAYPTLGVTFIAGTPPDPAGLIAHLVAARADIEGRGGSLVIESWLPDDAGAPDRWGTAPPAFALMQQLKARFDPAGRLNPRSFVGGL